MPSEALPALRLCEKRNERSPRQIAVIREPVPPTDCGYTGTGSPDRLRLNAKRFPRQIAVEREAVPPTDCGYTGSGPFNLGGSSLQPYRARGPKRAKATHFPYTIRTPEIPQHEKNSGNTPGVRVVRQAVPIGRTAAAVGMLSAAAACAV